MKVFYSVAVGVGAFFALNCGSGDEGTGYPAAQSGAPAAAPTGAAESKPTVTSDVVEVKVTGHDFDPPEVHIKANQSVRWVWVSGSHNVISGAACTPDGLFSSGGTDVAPTTFEHKFEKTGSFPFYCDPHCGVGMKGKVTVD